MSTPVTTNGDLRDAPNFCRSCGTPLAGGRFCPECGSPVSAGEDEVRVPDTLAELEADADETTDDLTNPRTYEEPAHEPRTAAHSRDTEPAPAFEAPASRAAAQQPPVSQGP